jgi:hypothetical protein
LDVSVVIVTSSSRRPYRATADRGGIVKNLDFTAKEGCATLAL